MSTWTETDRRRIAFNLADVVKRGVVEVHSADADAFGTDTQWGNVEGRTTWHAWGRRHALSRGCARAWDRAAEGVEIPTDVVDALRGVWSLACLCNELPEVLDLRGAPESCCVLVERWRDALADAIRRATRGIVIIVERDAWVLGRLLPDRVGSP
jgi:hypothetical protein